MSGTDLVYSMVFIAAVLFFVWLYNRSVRNKYKSRPNYEFYRRRVIERERNSPPKPEPLKLSLERFGPAQLEGLSDDERVGRLAELARVLESKIPSGQQQFGFFNETTPYIIEGLTDIGHDLCDWDISGGDEQMWGANYMRPDTKGKLVVHFVFPATVHVGWESISNSD